MKTAPKQNRLHNLVLSGLFVGLGLLLPYLTAHAFGVPGTVFLPMHIPVLLCGLICGWPYGAACGLLAPLLSGLLTGMPPLWPMLPIMAAELIVYGLVSGLLHRKFRLLFYLALPGAMVAGRVAYGLVFALLNTVGTAPLRAAGVWAALVTGLPGIALQLVLVPILAAAIERATGRQITPARPGAMAEAKAVIRAGEWSCLVIKGGRIVHRDKGRGVSPLLRLYDTEEGRQTLAGAAVADKIIGKAAAMILGMAGATKVYGEVMSAAARDYLHSRGIPYEYGRCVDLISNRTGSGICPIEKSVLDIEDEAQAYAAIKKAVAELMGQATG